MYWEMPAGGNVLGDMAKIKNCNVLIYFTKWRM